MNTITKSCQVCGVFILEKSLKNGECYKCRKMSGQEKIAKSPPIKSEPGKPNRTLLRHMTDWERKQKRTELSKLRESYRNDDYKAAPIKLKNKFDNIADRHRKKFSGVLLAFSEFR